MTQQTLEQTQPERQTNESSIVSLNDSKLMKEKNSAAFEQPVINMRKYVLSTASLCLAISCQTYLLVSVFPYSGYMAMFLIPGLTTETAGSVAGLISSVHMLGRALSSFTWGKIADTIGRKPVFYCSFIFPALFSIWFGLSTSLFSALVARFLMGFGNGLLLVCKTTVSELAKGDDKLEASSMGLVMGMWGWGFLVCPVISGFLSEPVKQYPDSLLVQRFEPLLSTYPFLLPNLISVIMCMGGLIMVYFFVDETLPEEKIKPLGVAFEEFVEKMKAKLSFNEGSKAELLPLRDTMPEKESNGEISGKSLDTAVTNTDESSRGTNVKDDDDGLMVHSESCTMLSTTVGYDSHKAITSPSVTTENKDEIETQPILSPSKASNKKRKKEKATMASIWALPSTRDHLIGYWLYSFSNIIIDEGFPLFCMATLGGLNLTESGIGKILSGGGLIFVLAQYSIYSFLVAQYGVYKSMVIGSIFAAPITIFIPLSLYLNRNVDPNSHDLSLSSYLFLCLILGVKNIGGNIVFSSVTIATNRTVAAEHRATMNGLSMLGGSFAKAVGPAFGGFLVSFLLGGSVLQPTVGTVILFAVIGLVGIYCVYFVLVVLGKYHKSDKQ